MGLSIVAMVVVVIAYYILCCFNGEINMNYKKVLDKAPGTYFLIKDKNNNEWVWVEVPKTTVFADLTIDTTQELTEQNYTDIKNKLIAYATTYRKGSATQNCSWTDEWYAKDGSTLVTAST